MGKGIWFWVVVLVLVVFVLAGIMKYGGPEKIENKSVETSGEEIKQGIQDSGEELGKGVEEKVVDEKEDEAEEEKQRKGEGVYYYDGKNGEVKIEVKGQPGTSLIMSYVYADVDGKNVVFPLRYYPDDVEDVDVSGDVVGVLDDKESVYVTRDLSLIKSVGGYANIAAMEFSKVLIQKGIETYPALTVKNEDYPIYEAVECGDVSGDVGVVYMKLGDDERVYVEDGCVIVEGRDRDGLLMSVDRLAYALLGVM